MEDSDCMIQGVTPKKRKKMRQAQLSFQTLSSSKSPNSTDNKCNMKKRKIKTPLIGSKSSKMIKLATKENSVKKVPEKERESTSEKELDISNDIVISDDEKNDLSQSDQQNTRKIDSTPKRNNVGKNKKQDKSQQKPGALTKFLKKTDKEFEKSDDINNLSEQKSSDDNNLPELKDKDCQDTSVHNETNEVCTNESSDTQCIRSELDTSQLSEIDDSVNKDTDLSLRETDCDITILSSDNEALSELDKSISSINKATDKPTSPVTPTTPKTDKDKNQIKKLTPKQLQRRQEIVKKKEEKQRLKMEKEKKREEEKANRRRERKEKQREKEEKERIEKEQKKKEKELKELKKQIEIEQKQKEKEAKEEERKKREEAREEEKRRKEEERLEAERKKQKAASNFASFFVSKKQEVKSAEEESVVGVKNFMPFEIKADMKIAPIYRRKLTEYDKLLFDDKCNIDLDKSELYLEDIKKRRIVPRTSTKTWPLEAKDEIILLDDDNDDSSNIITNTHNLEKHRPKLLQFDENRRPPYWGTWRKRSIIINSRRPFAKDKVRIILYLSEEEAQADEEEMEDMSPQTQKMKLKILGEQFEAERNTKTYKLKPRIIGIIWQGPGNLFPESSKYILFIDICILSGLPQVREIREMSGHLKNASVNQGKSGISAHFSGKIT
ncbi:Chromatin assembly factor 1 subunit A-B [Cyphomyrmex costatus]|uniref:Chromatin assembly factor 1 subunit A-B n=1 Tax=Cyphomyrmex costatus TaxID=456900 RepID=A0A195C3Y8_9HYME|nr:Chromatin assembly factor 1 subunit A-B [Cyphomyrmex costatus]